MPRRLIGDRAMTSAERQARCRAARAEAVPTPRTQRQADHRSRARRWQDAVAELMALQVQYANWLDTLPENLQTSPTADALQAICELDLAEIQAITPPRGFGRD